jgi:D-glycero-alpha-D-manno-heptose 1-phosphate guanylyltransferase
MEAIVLAGGLGTRLASRLHGLPKPMAPVAGRPFLEILLNQLRRSGCTRVLLSVGRGHSVIQDYFGASFNGMSLDYVVESVPLGTGGAIRMAMAQATEDTVLAMNGDTFRQIDYAGMMRFHRTQGATATMAVVHQPDIARYGGVVVEQEHVVAFVEKGRPGPDHSATGHSGPGHSGPGWINAGAYVFSRNLDWPANLGEKFSIEIDFFMHEVARLRPAAYEMQGYFLDIGVPEDLDRAQTELARFTS